MVIYKTFTTSAEGVQTINWQASQTEASKARGAAKKLGSKAESQTVNIPTAKSQLIGWLNENAVC
jgi:hypothetical protein